jgi:D-alanine-D-alanine ligase
MRVVILYDRIVEEGGSPDQKDVLVQAEAVSESLAELGHEPISLTFSLDAKAFAESVKRVQPDLAFNLVESVEGHGRLIHLAAAVLDFLRVPYTGSPTDTLFLTTNKLLTKRILEASGIPTPPYFRYEDLATAEGPLDQPYIIKSVWEHASVGLDEDSVVFVANPRDLLSEMERRKEKLGGECFAEKYIEGREFNLSILASDGGPEVLPPAEIKFENYPPGKWRVVGYRAKWDENSHEYWDTVRRFQFSPDDEPLLVDLREMAKKCWSLFGLRGYGRVDFRVDQLNQPWVLEINANPCLSLDAGFFAATTRAGLSYKEMVRRIIQDSEIGFCGDRVVS